MRDSSSLRPERAAAWTFKGEAQDLSGKYRIEILELRAGGFAVGWRWTVYDQSGTDWVVDSDTAPRDADAWCEAWAVVALALAAQDSDFQGAYSIGISGY